MKPLLVTAAFVSAVASLSISAYSPDRTLMGPSNTSIYFQDTTPKRSNAQNRANMQQGQYRDIRTGRPLTLNYNQQSRSMYNTATGKPVDFYINVSTGDTISGNGYIVNNYLQMQPDSSYRLDTGRIRMSNNRYYMMEGGKELPMDKNWQSNRTGGNRRDSL